MDSLSTQKAKPRKMKVVLKKSRVQLLLDLFYRVIEITVVLVTVAKLCYQLAITLEDFGLASFLINRHVAFVLGNTIVIALVAKYGFFVNQEPDSQRNCNDFYDQFVWESSRGDWSLHTDVICREKQSEAENESKQSTKENREKQSNEDKRQSSEIEREKQKTTENRSKQSSVEEREKKDITMNKHSSERSRSENLEGSKKSSCGRLKRSETERSADGFDSDDELRYKIESFIARQRRNQKDEEFCII